MVSSELERGDGEQNLHLPICQYLHFAPADSCCVITHMIASPRTETRCGLGGSAAVYLSEEIPESADVDSESCKLGRYTTSAVCDVT